MVVIVFLNEIMKWHGGSNLSQSQKSAEKWKVIGIVPSQPQQFIIFTCKCSMKVFTMNLFATCQQNRYVPNNEAITVHGKVITLFAITCTWTLITEKCVWYISTKGQCIFSLFLMVPCMCHVAEGVSGVSGISIEYWVPWAVLPVIE